MLFRSRARSRCARSSVMARGAGPGRGTVRRGAATAAPEGESWLPGTRMIVNGAARRRVREMSRLGPARTLTAAQVLPCAGAPALVGGGRPRRRFSPLLYGVGDSVDHVADVAREQR